MDSFLFFLGGYAVSNFRLCLAENPPGEVVFKSGVIMRARNSKGKRAWAKIIQNKHGRGENPTLSHSSTIRARIYPLFNLPGGNYFSVASQYRPAPLIFIREIRKAAKRKKSLTLWNNSIRKA